MVDPIAIAERYRFPSNFFIEAKVSFANDDFDEKGGARSASEEVSRTTLSVGNHFRKTKVGPLRSGMTRAAFKRQCQGLANTSRNSSSAASVKASMLFARSFEPVSTVIARLIGPLSRSR